MQVCFCVSTSAHRHPGGFGKHGGVTAVPPMLGVGQVEAVVHLLRAARPRA